MKAKNTLRIRMMEKPMTKTPFHPTAYDEVMELIFKDVERLITQSRIAASSNNAPIVLSNHVKEAYSLLSNRSGNSQTRDAVIILGSTFLGAFLPGFVEGVQNGNILGIVVWVVVGLIGTTLTMFGLWGMK